MTSLGAALLVLEEDSFESCLKSLEGFDEVGILSDSLRLRDIFASRGYVVRVIERPACVEQVGAHLLSVAESDWLLLLDPDERLVCPNLPSLRQLVESSPPGVAGYWVDYRLSIFGRPLDTTYSRLSKSKLVRRDRVCWPNSIHGLPIPREGTHVFHRCPNPIAHVSSDLMADPVTRLRRHLQWATVESAAPGDRELGSAEIAATLKDVVNEYFVDRACSEDGVAGVLAGLLHVNKEITSLLLRASVEGVDARDEQATQAFADAMRRVVDVLAEPSRL